jgi:hypothetical protein
VYTVTGIPDPEASAAGFVGASPARRHRRGAGRGGIASASPSFGPANPHAPARFAVDLLDVSGRRSPGDIAKITALAAAPARHRVRRAAPPDRPNARDELWIDRAHRAARLTAEWLVYERDTPAPAARRGRGCRSRASGRGGLMGISFDAPLALALLPVLAAVVVALHVMSRRRLGRGRRRAALGVRVLLLSALVGALAGIQLVLPVDRLAVVFVVDLSDSVGTAGREESLAYLRTALEEKKDEDVAGIVAFGGTRWWRAPVGPRRDRPHRVHAGQGRHRHRGRAAPRRGTVPGRRAEADRTAVGRQRHHGLRPDGGGPGGGARDPGQHGPHRPRRP